MGPRGLTALFLFAPFAAAQSVAVSVTVSNTVDAPYSLFMSTSFQPAEWDDQFFVNLPQQTVALTQLEPQHIRIQALSQDVPESTQGTWNFTHLNGVMTPIQSSADHSPEFQIAVAPSYLDASNGQMIQTPANQQAFARYAANLVEYYNLGGFDVNGQHFQSPSPYPIEYWGIFNEPNGNGLTAQNYVDLYNTVVPQMAATDPNVKFVAVELSDYGDQVDQYMPTFVSQVQAHVDVVATHFYSTCNQSSTDQELFQSVPGFASDVSKIYAYLATNPALAHVPVWVTENNVNADYSLGNGISACNGTPFTTDVRGSNAFFAAWRPYVLSQLAKAGAEALYHWDYNADQQFGEVDGNTGDRYLSYWVDYYLAHLFPTPPAGLILHSSVSDPRIESLAVGYPDGSVSVLLANLAVANASDNNGMGLPVTVTLDLSSLGSGFSSVSEYIFDRTTSAATGPVLNTLPATPQIQISFIGYGSALLRLNQDPVNLTAAGVANAAGYQSGAVAPGEILTLFGTGLGPPDLAKGKASYPRVQDDSLEGVRVFFGTVPAPIVYASSQQVSVVVPYELTGQFSTLAQLEYLGNWSPPFLLSVTDSAPGIFSMSATGTGQGAILNQDFTINSAGNAASPGDIIQIFATGEGNPQGNYVTGLFPTSSPVDPNVSVTIGGVPAKVIYAGVAPYEIGGLMQVNAKVPAGTAAGPVPVQIAVGSATSQSGITLAVK